MADKERVARSIDIGAQWVEIRGGVEGKGRYALWRVRCVGDTLEVRLADTDVPCALRMEADHSNTVTLSPRRPTQGEGAGQ